MHDLQGSLVTRAEIDLSSFRPRALVFDLDGTLTDNMRLHAEAFAEFMRRRGRPTLSSADRRRLDGKRNSEIFPDLFGRPMTPEEVLAFEEEKEGLYRQVSKGRLSPMAGLDELIAGARARGVRLAVATSAPKPNVEHTLREIGLEWLLAHVVRGDEVPRGKPFPDVFLEAARRVGLPPGQCLAFEDAPIGVEAAVTAGMACVALTTSFDHAAFAGSHAPPHACAPDFAAFLDGHGAWLRNSAGRA
jgi:HAD superfamily hydrolase (TIGR01509 family)